MDLTTARVRLLEIVSQFVDHPIDNELNLDNILVVSSETLDSFSVMSVIAIVEDEFQITFSPEDLSSERMRTFGGMLDVILKKNEKK